MRYVLFVCNHNAGRSQMAEGFFERLAPPDVRVESAGTEPADSVWPAVIEATAEVGVDLSRKRPKRLTVEMQLHADWAITMGCGDSCPYVPTTVEDKIRACADAVLASYDGARVRSFVMTLAYRKARECLAAGAARRCSGLASDLGRV